MVSLGDFFSEEQRNSYSNRSIALGTVIRSPVVDTTPPKFKFWIIIGISSDGTELGVIYVNTELNNFIQRNNILKQLQVLIQHDGRKLVDYDCYANCSEIKRKSAADIQQQLLDNPSYIRGELNSAELNHILEILKSASTISPREKKHFQI